MTVGRGIEGNMAEDNNKSKEQAIVEWLRLVDKPLTTKDKKDIRSSDKRD